MKAAGHPGRRSAFRANAVIDGFRDTMPADDPKAAGAITGTIQQTYSVKDPPVAQFKTI